MAGKPIPWDHWNNTSNGEVRAPRYIADMQDLNQQSPPIQASFSTSVVHSPDVTPTPSPWSCLSRQLHTHSLPAPPRESITMREEEQNHGGKKIKSFSDPDRGVSIPSSMENRL